MRYMYKILLAEDDREIANLERDYLSMNEYEVDIAYDGEEAEEKLKSVKYDLIILDIMMPKKSGYDLCREYRDQTDVPILMVTAKTESIDKIRGLGLGADDYVVKPFDPLELVARVKSHLARYERLTGKKTDSETNTNVDEKEYDADNYMIEIGDLKIMTRSWKAIKNGKEIHFPNREFELLKYLAMNPNIVFSKEHLFERIWGYDYMSDSATVTVHINRIREKIEDDPKNPQIIETVWGAGYRLNLR
ncbi:MAG: response regulator transcription factor [Roseburia intestinalis]